MFEAFTFNAVMENTQNTIVATCKEHLGTSIKARKSSIYTDVSARKNSPKHVREVFPGM